MKKVFLLIFLSFLIYFVLIPPLHLPDEPEHYENTFWLSHFIYPYQPTNRNKPKLFVDNLVKTYFPFNLNTVKNSTAKYTGYNDAQIKKLEPITLQSYHPPLYYFFVSFSHDLSNIFNLDFVSRFYMARLFSGLFYLGMVIIAFRILKLLFTDDPLVCSLLLFFALNPLVLKTGVGINPDLGVAFFSLLFLYAMIAWQKKRVLRLKRTLIFACIAAAATLSKVSGSFTLMAYPIYALVKSKIIGKTAMHIAVFFVLCFLLFVPWFALNLQRYGTLSPKAFYTAENQSLNPHTIFVSIALSVFEFRHTIMHYAGFLGAQNNINPPKPFFIGYAIIISILALTGFISLVKDTNKRKLFMWVVAHFILLTFFLFILGIYFKKQGLSWDLQGRYYIPGFFALVIFMYFGLLKLLKNKKTVIKIIFLVALIHWYYISFAVLIPFYYHWNSIISDLNAMYPFFGIIFAFILTTHLVLSLSMTKRLLK